MGMSRIHRVLAVTLSGVAIFVCGCASPGPTMDAMGKAYVGKRAPLRDPFDPVQLIKVPRDSASPTVEAGEEVLGELDFRCREKLLETRLTQFARRVGASRVEYDPYVPRVTEFTCDVGGVQTRLYRKYGETMTVRAWFLAPARIPTCKVVTGRVVELPSRRVD